MLTFWSFTTTPPIIWTPLIQEEIQNLPGLPEPELLPDAPPAGRRSPKKLESPVLENRKPGRPKSRPEHPGLMRKTENNGLTR